MTTINTIGGGGGGIGYATGDGFVITGITTSSITNSSSTAITYGGSEVVITEKATTKKERAKYSATLVFSFVKSKLNKIEQGRLKARIARLQYLLEACDETEQQALKDELVTHAAVAIREQEAAACGYDQFVGRDIIDRFRRDAKTQIDFEQLDKFPRPIPDKIRKKIALVREKGLFDELWVLYNNPNQEQLKSTKEKIVEKDPILFGRFVYAPDTFYYIADWIDEVCDLTFEQFIDRVKAVDPDFSVDRVTELTLKDLDAIKERARTQHDRLKTTNVRNWRDIAAQEQRDLNGVTGMTGMAGWSSNTGFTGSAATPVPHDPIELPKESWWSRLRSWLGIA